MEAYFKTDIGKVRNHNEDAGGIFYNQDNQLLAIVADGMGGHSGGEIASELATNLVEEEWASSSHFEKPTDVENWLSDTITKANNRIYEEAKKNDKLEGMGTTVVIAVATKEFVTIAHIGDSRCYVDNEDEFKQLTEDHSLVNELLRAGQITPDDALYHPRKNVLSRALGTEKDVKEDIQTISWEEGDKLLLCSDGLTSKVTNEELSEYLKKEKLDEVSEQLIHLANERGGEDNISVALIHHENKARVGEDE